MSQPLSNYLHTIDVGVLKFNPAEGRVLVLVNLRQKEPFAQRWALPGIVLNGDVEDEDIDDGVARLMASPKVGMKSSYIEQVGTVGSAKRDPRCWSSSTFYMAIVEDGFEPSDDQMFVDLEAVAQGKFNLAFDHNKLCALILERLISKSMYSNFAVLLLGKEFTTAEAIKIFKYVRRRQDIAQSAVAKRINKLVEVGLVKDSGRRREPEGRGRPNVVFENLNLSEIYFFDRTLEQ
ncbi:NUDIX hydrolase [Pseudomonas aeruginosa]